MDYRREFFDFEDVTFLNCASQGPFPRVAAAAVENALGLKTRPDRIHDDIYFRLPNEARHEMAALFGGHPEDYAITNGASDGLFAVARGVRWERGDEVLVAEDDFPAHLITWGALADHGVSVRPLSADGGSVTTRQLLSTLGRHTRVVSVSYVNYNSGYRLDVEQLGQACRENGTLLVLDVSQAAGSIELSFDRLPVDVAVCAGYKWLLSPYGTGFAWFHPEARSRLHVSDVYWQAVEGAENFNRLPRFGWKLAAGARRFDSTETASFLNVSAMVASLRFLRRVGIDYVEAHTRRLLDCLVGSLPGRFRPAASMQPGERSSLIGITADDTELVRRAYETLRAANVVVSLRQEKIRVSPNVYNNDADIARCADILGTVE